MGTKSIISDVQYEMGTKSIISDVKYENGHLGQCGTGRVGIAVVSAATPPFPVLNF